ncbi:Lrp/AsnC family transcriptional regulator [Rhodococcus sp. T2V]|uniref:Lrp/AsnC family transcriptional regulator n=1 Tax=Rhodococcus sp. T2V TaxID=3034164 RepID=UPI0023E20124|nr:Lrp/AsnC family transcriptional regulator [Rhodococcus sp. T2V]MDF3312836.1 Lrp/AsnC family transcriptional regulator [Rhodococcus sp. T2V]
MRGDLPVDETDLRVINLLQIAPRIPWAGAGEILDLSPSAVAARWRRLSNAGIAWISAYRNLRSMHGIAAFVNVACKPRHRRALIDSLRAYPQVVSVVAATGRSDLALTVTIMVPDLQALSILVMDEIAGMRGVIDTATRVVTQLHAEGAAWRLDALEPREAALARDAAQISSERASGLPETQRRALVRALVANPRVSVADLARELGGTAPTVRRQLSQVLASGQVNIRCDISAPVAGWPIECNWMLRVPATDVLDLVVALRSRPQVRLCASVIGDANLVITTLSRSMPELNEFERWLGTMLPRAEVRETFIGMRTFKRMGRILNDDGYATGEMIPIE